MSSNAYWRVAPKAIRTTNWNHGHFSHETLPKIRRMPALPSLIVGGEELNSISEKILLPFLFQYDHRKNLFNRLLPHPLLSRSAWYYWTCSVTKERRCKTMEICYSFTKTKIGPSNFFENFICIRKMFPYCCVSNWILFWMKWMKKLNKGRFLHVKSWRCDNEFHATNFLCCCITAVCVVKSESNDPYSKTKFLLVWCMLFFINRLLVLKLIARYFSMFYEVSEALLIFC